MKTVSAIYHNYGSDMSTSMSFVKFSDNLENFPINDTRCFSYDDNGLIMTKVSELRLINVPDWAETSPLFFRDNSWNMFYLLNCKSFVAVCDDENIAKKLLIIARSHGVESAEKLAEVLNYSGKSDFQQSIKKQVVAWFSEESPKYSFPLSYAQFTALTKFDKRFSRRY